MKAILAKYWRRLRWTEKDADRRLRAECIAVASHYRNDRVAHMLRGAQYVYNWIENGKLPPEPESGALE